MRLQITEERAEGEVAKERAEGERGGGRCPGIGTGLEVASVQSWGGAPARGGLDVGDGTRRADDGRLQVAKSTLRTVAAHDGDGAGRAK